MGGACSAYRKEDRRRQGFGGEIWGKGYLRGKRRMWKDNNKMDHQELGCAGVNWTDLVQGRERWRALVNAVMNFRGS